MDKKFHQEKAAEILFQIIKKMKLETKQQLSKPIAHSFRQPSLKFPSQEKINNFFANPGNIKKLEKKFDENLVGILKYLLRRKKERGEKNL